MLRMLRLYIWLCFSNTKTSRLMKLHTYIHHDAPCPLPSTITGGWSGVAKVSCILRHRGIQLILAYSWARLAVLVAGKGRGEYFISSVSFLSFLFLFLPCPSLSSTLLSFLLYYLFYLFSPFLWETTQNDP